MESNAHRRSLGNATLDPIIDPIQCDILAVLPSLTANKNKKRLVPAVEGRKRASKKTSKSSITISQPK